MYKKAKPFFLIAETPLHVGSGTELGIVDLPIQREKHTGFPKIESSGLKGTIRRAFAEDNKKIKVGNKEVNNTNREECVSLVFGPEEGDTHAGALGFTDARIFLFPVKSMQNIFAWITCPKVLTRFKLDLQRAGIDDLPEIPDPNSIPEKSELIVNNNKIILEEYTFEVKKDISCSKFAQWISNKVFSEDKLYDYWRKKITQDIVILTDNDFRDFVTLYTEVVTRTRINTETRTVKTGGLFTEEYLPTETILYSLALASPIFKESLIDSVFLQNDKKQEDLVMEYFIKGLPEVLQIGGNATLGKGIVRTRIIGDEIAEQ